MSLSSEEEVLLQRRAFAILKEEAIAQSPLQTDPYDFVFVRNAIKDTACSTLLADAPRIESGGSHPLSELSFGPAFNALIDDLESPRFREIIEAKFNLDLKDRFTTVSVRGRVSRASDGYEHTDLADKVISVLLYLNSEWHDAGGALRVLRSKNIDDYALEIPPLLGNILIFRRSERSWHGHLPYEGPRLSVQFNWVKSARRPRQYWRHRFNFLKSIISSRG